MSKRLAMPNEGREVTKTPGHWVLAQLGKKVLRPGGKELTQKMLQGLAITRDDCVVEFAPGMGYTARLCLENPLQATPLSNKMSRQPRLFALTYRGQTNVVMSGMHKRQG